MNLVKHIRSSLTLKATVLFGSAAIAASLMVVLLSAFSEYRDQATSNRDRGQALAKTSAAVLAPLLISGDHAGAEKVRAQLARQPGVLHLDVRDPENAGADAVLPGSRVKNGVLFDDVPIYNNGALVATLHQAYDLQPGQKGLLALIMKNAWKGLILSAAAIPAALLVFIRLLTPLAALTRASARAASGDLSVRLKADRTDELGILSSNFNTMLERLKRNLDRSRWLAYGDGLTRLANKTAFGERLRQCVGPGQPPGALLLIDVDGFKRFNDAYGQEQGDRILTIIAQRLRAVVKANCAPFQSAAKGARPLLARLSGDEFGVLVPGARSVSEIQVVGSAMLEAIAAPIDISGHTACLSARIGIALYPHDAADERHLMTSVNFAIDEAKKAGGGTLRFFEPSMSQKALQRMTLQNELRIALQKNQFVVYYQPKINVRDGTIAGCEALVRWQPPDGPLIGPGRFIEAAEESGLIREIGNFVLESSCHAAARWIKAGYDCPVAVNVSALQFASDNFTPVVFDVLSRSGLPPQKLELELTESVAMTNPERMLEQIGPLRDQGVRFAIDDFGTGHSSLAYLTRLPFDVFKIDQSFVQTMTEDKHARVIVQTVLAMAESLGYRTVAEGVETREHFAFLQLHCCDYVQGYYFAKPMPEAALLEMLQSERESLAHTPDAELARAG